MPAVKLEDLHDFLTLRRVVENPWETVRFRLGQREGSELAIRFLREPPLHLRGETNDFHIFHRIFLRDEYRLEGLGGWDCVVDLGGNAGFFAARAAQIARRVIAYEPVPAHFARLKQNCEGRPVEAVQAAVAESAGRLRLYRPVRERLTGVHSLHRDMGGMMTDAYDEVDTVTLDDVFRRHDIARCDLLKLDVEGSEYGIVHSASPAVLRRIDRIHGEYHNVQPDDPRTRIDHFAGYLRELGFEVDLVRHRRKPNHGTFFATRPNVATARPRAAADADADADAGSRS